MTRISPGHDTYVQPAPPPPPDPEASLPNLYPVSLEEYSFDRRNEDESEHRYHTPQQPDRRGPEPGSEGFKSPWRYPWPLAAALAGSGSSPARPLFLSFSSLSLNTSDRHPSLDGKMRGGVPAAVGRCGRVLGAVLGGGIQM